MMQRKRRILYVVASPMTARHILLPHLPFLLEHSGLEVIIVCSPGPDLECFAGMEGVLVVPIGIEREIAPFRDVVSLWRLFTAMRKLRPALVNVGTPKGGVLGMAAAWAARVPKRVYTLHGLRLETATGLRRRVLSAAEKIACRLADQVICVSPSLKRRTLALNLAEPERFEVLGVGSWNGVDAQRFGACEENLRRAEALRKTLGLAAEARVVGFVGRLTRDKGVVELVRAFEEVVKWLPDVRLLLVGGFEAGDRVPADTRRTIEQDPRIITTGWVEDTAPYYQLMTVLAFPSYREGFPGVLLEAAAAGTPVVGTRATGVVDAVVDGVTGLLAPVGEGAALAQGIRTLLEDPDLAGRLGRAARERAFREFDPERIWGELICLYRQLLAETPRKPRTMAALLKRTVHPSGALSGIVHPAETSYRRWGKRAVEVVLSALALTGLSPVILATALAVRCSLGKPVLFRQERPGRNCTPFTLLKFRTMKDVYDSSGRLLPDAQRITRLGRILRATSIDELPQLFNVLVGDMSMVGPRPQLAETIEVCSESELRRQKVRPGITGLAQVTGRNRTTWGERFERDLYYVDHCSFRLDCWILLKTLSILFRGDGGVLASEQLGDLTATTRSYRSTQRT